jgi:hypothetical protein
VPGQQGDVDALPVNDADRPAWPAEGRVNVVVLSDRVAEERFGQPGSADDCDHNAHLREPLTSSVGPV